MYKACSRCGKIHSSSYKCHAGQVYAGGRERTLRSSNVWSIKSRQIREQASNLCEMCKAEGVITYKGLEVHHIEKLTDREDLLLDDSNLVCLCQRHHKDADKGLISKDHLRDLARLRIEDAENNTPHILRQGR